MALVTLKHSRAAYVADFVLYGCAVAAMAGALLLTGPGAQRGPLLALAAAGLASWTLIEYLLHRFVLHGLQPFKGWHAQHHDHPTALLGAPVVLSAGLITAVVLVPVWLLAGLWPALALTLGIAAGYLAYGLTHHFTHHGHRPRAWLARRRRWHALHHSNRTAPGCYGVTSGVWDRVFGTALAG